MGTESASASWALISLGAMAPSGVISSPKWAIAGASGVSGAAAVVSAGVSLVLLLSAGAPQAKIRAEAMKRYAYFMGMGFAKGAKVREMLDLREVPAGCFGTARGLDG